MPLETLEQTNIMDLAIKTPEKRKEYLFDPYRDLPEEVWKSWILFTKDYRFRNDLEGWMSTTTAQLVLRPDRSSELHIDEEAEELADITLDVIMKSADDNRTSLATPFSDNFLKPLSDASILFPSSAKIRSYASPDTFQKIQKEISEAHFDVHSYHQTRNFVNATARLKLAFPGNERHLILPTEEDIQLLVEGLKRETRLDINSSRLQALASLRILFPNMNMKRSRDSIPTDHSKIQFSPRDLMNLAIISADKVVVDDTGLHLEFNHDRKAPPEEVASPPTSLKF